jgi:hypothetical protein
LKTITVREAAAALNLTKRAVMYRLDNGKLKGIRVKNNFGMDEWRIYPTKEIIEGLQRAVAANPTTEPGDPVHEETLVDVDDVDFEDSIPLTRSNDSIAWQEQERDRLKLLAEEVVRPLVDRIDAQSKLLVRKEMELEELKVKLLPDLEKKAEEERKAAELKNLEVTALQRQVEALQTKIDEQKRSEEEQIKSFQARLAELSKLEAAAQDVELAKQKAAELESVLPHLQQQLEKQTEEKSALEAELHRMQEEKESKIALLQVELETAKKPWWKAWFAASSQARDNSAPPAKEHEKDNRDQEKQPR